MDDKLLKQKIEKLKSTMIAVSTGGPRIDDVNFEFGEAYDLVSIELSKRRLENPFPYRDLWEWYGRWSADFPTWASRRQFAAELVGPLLLAIRNPSGSIASPTGWARVDRTVGKGRQQLATATSAEDFQAVGLFCREALISLGQEVFDEVRHISIDGVNIGASDFKRQIEAFLELELKGPSSKEARRHARSALDLSSQLLHQRTATFREAAICMEATATVANIIAIISGRVGPP